MKIDQQAFLTVISSPEKEVPISVLLGSSGAMQLIFALSLLSLPNIVYLTGNFCPVTEKEVGSRFEQNGPNFYFVSQQYGTYFDGLKICNQLDAYPITFKTKEEFESLKDFCN